MEIFWSQTSTKESVMTKWICDFLKKQITFEQLGWLGQARYHTNENRTKCTIVTEYQALPEIQLSPSIFATGRGCLFFKEILGEKSNWVRGEKKYSNYLALQ